MKRFSTIFQLLLLAADRFKSAAKRNAVKINRCLDQVGKQPYYRVLEQQYRPLPSTSEEYTDLQLYTPKPMNIRPYRPKAETQIVERSPLQLQIEGIPLQGEQIFSSIPVRLVTKNKLGRKRRFRANLRNLGLKEAQIESEVVEAENQPEFDTREA